MIVQVARAIAETQVSSDWQSLVIAARAAILAMREPTAEMLDAVAGGLPDLGHIEEDWRAMIDCAAKGYPIRSLSGSKPDCDRSVVG